MDNIWILAQAESNQGPTGITSEQVTEENEAVTTVPSDPNGPAAQKPKPKPLIPFWILIPLMLVMVFMLFRGPQKQKQQRKQLVQSLKKNDRVQTIGGIIGTIVDIKGDEITLKVDESNNTKIKIVSSAIGKNISKD
ncbi:MAG: preprotein translocase subunit YajC [Phycisphaerae bacterium]|nr:preprotein translocase subunit YajC [Phycisphaerae bacterium]